MLKDFCELPTATRHGLTADHCMIAIGRHVFSELSGEIRVAVTFAGQDRAP
jgi:hypothetical protein